MFESTSLFQNLRTRKPSFESQADRSSSRRLLSACWPPSASTISFPSNVTKSTMYGPIGACLRNFHPARSRRRRFFHRTRSASVECNLSLRALSTWLILRPFPLTSILSHQGRGGMRSPFIPNPGSPHRPFKGEGTGRIAYTRDCTSSVRGTWQLEIGGIRWWRRGRVELPVQKKPWLGYATGLAGSLFLPSWPTAGGATTKASRWS